MKAQQADSQSDALIADNKLAAVDLSALPEFAELESQEVEVADFDADMPEEATAGIIDADQFYELYLKGAFSGIEIGYNLMAERKGLPVLSSISIQSSEEASARAASDRLYDICLRTPWLSWMVEPANENIQTLIIIGSFAMIKTNSIRTEITQLKQEKGGNEDV